MSFAEAFKDMQIQVHQINKDHGFNEIDDLINDLAEVEDPRVQRLLPTLRDARKGLKLMLIVSELGETLEAIRKGNQPDSHIPEYTGEEAELADAVIRIMNMANDDGSRIADAIVAKSAYNAARPYKHGGKKF